jgi:autophagy-related protein 9
MAIDEENLGGHFEHQDLEVLLAEAAGSEISEKNTATRPSNRGAGRLPATNPSRITPKWMRNNAQTRAARQEEEEDDDDEVPASLMLEEHKETSPMLGRNQRRDLGGTPYELPLPVPGPSTGNARAQWEATRRQQQLHDNRPTPVSPAHRPGRGASRLSMTADPKERALWKWAQVENLDGYLQEVYTYYDQKGIWSILLRQGLMLL